MGRIIMGYWDCQYCGAKGNPGDKRECPKCGHPRDESVTFYMKDKEYVSAEKAETVSKNPDWYCSFCNTLNSDNDEFCKGCGASKADSEKNYFEIQEEKRRKALEAAQAAHPQAPTRARSGKKWIFFGILAALLLFFLFPRKTPAKITSLDWERNISIEQNVLCEEDGWSLPSGAELTSSREEIHHYDHVIDHYEDVEVEKSRQVIDHYDTEYEYRDMGNGYFEEVPHDVPVYKTEYYYETERRPVYVDIPQYQTKYYYTIWRWKENRKVTDSGTGHTAKWPEYTLASDEREGARSGTYTVTFTTEKGKTRTYEMSESDWNGVNIGDEYDLSKLDNRFKKR